MINRYQGNSGRVVRIEERPEPGQQREKTRPQHPKPAGNTHAAASPTGNSHGNPPGRGAVPPARNSKSAPAGGGVQHILSQLGKLLPGSAGKMAALETEDIILLLILYLMYRESGDSELLMMMGAMFLL